VTSSIIEIRQILRAAGRIGQYLTFGTGMARAIIETLSLFASYACFIDFMLAFGAFMARVIVFV